MDWRDDARCRGVDPDRFFDIDRIDEAKEICQSCDVIVNCLLYATQTGSVLGVWGGLDEKDRRRIARQKYLADGRVRMIISGGWRNAHRRRTTRAVDEGADPG